MNVFDKKPARYMCVAVTCFTGHDLLIKLLNDDISDGMSDEESSTHSAVSETCDGNFTALMNMYVSYFFKLWQKVTELSSCDSRKSRLSTTNMLSSRL